MLQGITTDNVDLSVCILAGDGEHLTCEFVIDLALISVGRYHTYSHITAIEALWYFGQLGVEGKERERQ